jgi:cytochrome oxidase Cu insertion factor (SCO1/SenC/PrrC family)
VISLRIFLPTVFLLVIFSLGGAEASEEVEAPDFTLKDTEGKYFNISDYEGNDTLVLFFMFTTCPGCEFFVDRVLDDYFDNISSEECDCSISILSISVMRGGDEKEDLKDYSRYHGWRHALDINESLEKAYNIGKVPTYVIIDKEGYIQYTSSLSLPLEQLEYDLYMYTGLYSETEDDILSLPEISNLAIVVGTVVILVAIIVFISRQKSIRL